MGSAFWTQVAVLGIAFSTAQARHLLVAPRNLLVAASPSGDYQYPWMSAKALATCSFEPATSHKAPEGLAAEIQFREELWREYRFEAINAGLSPAEAAEYATALSPLPRGLVPR